MKRIDRKCGFTLIELSIVLVIIGLIIGGVLVGRDLIKAAELRAQIKQIDEFKMAASTFKIKYGEMPGDISPTQASSLGFFTFTGSNAGQSVVTVIGPPFGSWTQGFGNNSGYVDPGESVVFWQHLSEASLVPGKYGAEQTAADYLVADTSDPNTAGQPLSGNYSTFLPYSKVSPASMMLVGHNRAYSGAPFYVSNSNQFFNYDMPVSVNYQLDVKLDDGMPNSGSVRDGSSQFMGWTVPSTDCVDSSGTPHVYLITSDFICQVAILW